MKPRVFFGLALLLTMVLCSPHAYSQDYTTRAVLHPFEPQFAESERLPFVHDPRGIVAAPSGWYILDAGNHRVLEVDPAGRVRQVIGGRGAGPGEMERPSVIRSVGVSTGDAQVEEVWVMDAGNRRIVRFGADGSVAGHHTSLRNSGSFCVKNDRFLVAASPASGHLIDAYRLDGTYQESFGPVDTLTAEGYSGPLPPAIRAENLIHLVCLEDQRTLVLYQNRPLVRILDATGRIVHEWTLRGGILDAIAARREQLIAERDVESSAPGYPTVPITWGGTALLPDGRLLIALQSSAFHFLDLETGAQTAYAYQNPAAAPEDGFQDLWYVGRSGDGVLLSADPQRDELFRVELVD